ARRSRPPIHPFALPLRPLAAPRRRALRLVRAPMKLVPILSVEPATGGLRYRLDVPEGDLGEPLQEEFRHPIDDGTIQALLYGADALLRSPESPNFAREAEARGAVLYRTLVPARLRDQLKAVRGPLLIRTSLYG